MALDLWMIALCVVGGCILLALLAFIIFKLCQKRRKRKNIKGKSNGQNGHVWQAHSKDVELGDEESSHEKLKEDGLCRDTTSGSTFPRRVKAEDQNPKPIQEDGLCEDTSKRVTYPKRAKAEDQFLLPVEKNDPSASESALKSAFPVGVSVITSSGSKENVDDERLKSNEEESIVQVHNVVGVDDVTPKKKRSDKEDKADTSSESSFDSDSNGQRENGTQHLIKRSGKKGRKIKRSMTFAERKRAKSLGNTLEDVPEYSKPIKRSASNPSIVVREKILQRDKRFDSLETWKSTVPLPEPDYPSPLTMPNPRQADDDADQDNVPPSYATSDSGVECLDALSGHDDESVNHCDSVPESPGIPLSQLTARDEDSSFSTYREHTNFRETSELRYNEYNEVRHTNHHDINGFQDNVVSMTTIKDHTALIDANAVKGSPSPSAANQQQIFFQDSPEKTTVVNVPHSDPKMALRNTSDNKWTVSAPSYPSYPKQTTERIQTEQQMDFRSVKLRPASKNYDQDTSFTIHGSNQGNTDSVAPSYGKTDTMKNVEVDPISLVHQQRPNTQTETVSSSHSGQQSINSVTDGAKEHFSLDRSKKQNDNKETMIVTHRSDPETEVRSDFRGFKLRQIPQNVKQHIGFREEMEPNVTIQTQKHQENATSDAKEGAAESTVGVLDGIRRFQTQSQGNQAPKPLYGSHYISKKDPNLKPVHIVPPAPATIEREIPNPTDSVTSSEPSNTVRGVTASQKDSVTKSIYQS